VQGCVDSQEPLTGEDRPELSGTTKEVTKRNNTDHILDRLINWQCLLPPIKLFYNESKFSFPLTNESLRQICGGNTTFAGISCGYGIFPPKDICNSMDNISIEEWGINKYYIKDSSIRKYFKW
jgi:hypothetical protein